MSGAWAIDIGTTNTSVARWHATDERPVLVVLPNIAREPQPEAMVPPVIPSATHLLPGGDVWTRFGRWRPVARRAFLGRQAWIGRAALERNLTRATPAFAPTFKPHLQHQPHVPIARADGRSYSARAVARTYVRELLAEIWRSTGERLPSVTLTAPVDAYESYRMELVAAFDAVGVDVTRILDEPVAAAVGYGLSLRERRTVLVADMGGGTLDLALVELDGVGQATVLAKAGRPVGGDVVDRWLLDHVCARLGAPPPADPFWYRILLDEAQALKERLFLVDEEVFHLRPPGAAPGEIVVRRDEWTAVLEERGLPSLLEACIDEVCAAARPQEVLLVGGSTLLPGVFATFERRFGRDRVRAWQPFDAVVTGACTFAARGFATSDFIVHEYALLLRDPRTGAETLEPIVRAGTRFPTAPDLWRKQVVPTCPLGEPERTYSLVVYEVGRAPKGETSFGWDAAGRLQRLREDRDLVVPLNAHDPTLGRLDPPHLPGDKRPRLDLWFGVDADRWLVATVTDLRTGRTLMEQKPVVRLL